METVAPIWNFDITHLQGFNKANPACLTYFDPMFFRGKMMVSRYRP
jgi:hypothetical protein